jgi:Binding-protein-dependent transport system inner membrane component
MGVRTRQREQLGRLMPASSSDLDRRRDPRRAGALDMAFTLPYAVRMVRGHVEDVPGGLKESASTDGCTRWQARLKVVLPAARNGIFASLLFSFIFPWSDYIFVLVLTRTEVMTLTVEVTWHFGAPVEVLGQGPEHERAQDFTDFPRGRDHAALPRARHLARRGQGLRVADQAGASAPPMRVP